MFYSDGCYSCLMGPCFDCCSGDWEGLPLPLASKSSYDTSFSQSTRLIGRQVLMHICTRNITALYLLNYHFLYVKGKLLLSNPRIDYLKRSFGYSGALLRNNLPAKICTVNSLHLSKRSVSEQYYHTANK